MAHKVELICIGDELLIGQVVNTNASWIGNALIESGIKLNSVNSISDQKESILGALQKAHSQANFVLVTGGLGPTSDDITKPCICEYFNTALYEDETVVADVQSFFAKRGRPLTELNRKQAEVPIGAKIIQNHNGTAPGLHLKLDAVEYFFMPGVPFEMKAMMEEYVIPYLRSFYNNQLSTINIMTTGIGESFLADKIKIWEENLPSSMQLAYLPSPGIVRLRLTAFGKEKSILDAELKSQHQQLIKLIPNYIYAAADESIEVTLSRILKKQNKTIATAESCTGGIIAHKLTSIVGSSEFYKGSIVAYANSTKINVLGVSAQNIMQMGAVSEEVVKQMAINVRKMLQSDISIATSGIAGPDGGSEDKPVGTVWIGVATKEAVFAKKFNFETDRMRNINRASIAALNYCREILLNNNNNSINQ